MSFWKTYYHFVTATRERLPLIDSRTEELIRKSFQLTADDLGLIVHAFGLMPDHIHLTLSIPPRNAAADVAQRLKGAASHRVRLEMGTKEFGWQGDYGLLTFAERDLTRVNTYVLNQQSRHATGQLNQVLEQITEAH